MTGIAGPSGGRRRHVLSGGAGLAVLLALGAGGCWGGASESATSDSAPPVRRDTALERAAEELMPAVERSAGLEFRHVPSVARASRATLEEFLLRRLDDDLPPDRARAIRDAYARFGLVPDTLDLRSLHRRLFLSQVIGYYDPAADTLFVRTGVAGERLRMSLVHEMVHALQDQHVDLDSLTDSVVDRNDAGTAARAAVEGHATAVMAEWMMSERAGSRVDITALPAFRDLTAGADLAGLAGMPTLRDAPRVVRESLVFPYLGGMSFIQELWRAREGRPVPLGAETPASTEQILHPARYISPERDAPARLRFAEAPPAGWRRVHADELGELETRIFLETFLRDTAAARAAADGWDGDRYRLVEGPDGGRVLVWASAWDGPDEAKEFVRAAREAHRRRYEGGGDGRGATEGDEREISGGGRSVRVRRSELDGRAVVVVTDGPAVREESWPASVTDVVLGAER